MDKTSHFYVSCNGISNITCGPLYASEIDVTCYHCLKKLIVFYSKEFNKVYSSMKDPLSYYTQRLEQLQRSEEFDNDLNNLLND